MIEGDNLKSNTKNSIFMVTLIVMLCISMAIIETIIEPSYFVKSALKIALFLFVPLVIMKFQKERVFTAGFLLNKKRILRLLGLGLSIYAVIMVAFFLTNGIFDYSSLVNSLSADQKVSHNSFLLIAIYISFCNSFLEEFLFRFVAFIKLSEYVTKRVAYIFSSCMFALYHIAMIGGSFPVPLLLLALVGLAIGGVIFNYVDDKSQNIYNSWIIHMFADFAIMTIWYIHI